MQVIERRRVKQKYNDGEGGSGNEEEGEINQGFKYTEDCDLNDEQFYQVVCHSENGGDKLNVMDTSNFRPSSSHRISY